MKKKNTPSSFSELLERRYGGRDQDDTLGRSNSSRIDELFATYYGSSLPPTNRRLYSATVLALSYDNNELLPQVTQSGRFEEYVIQASVASGEFEEYVVQMEVPLPASSPYTALPASGDASVFQEYQVDLLQPLAPAVPEPQPRTEAAPFRGPTAQRVETPPRPAATAQSQPSREEMSRAEATEDDFVADLQAILTGQKVYDPNIGKTIDKDKISRSQSAPTHDDEPPMRDVNDSQAIFDRIAQSMQYANAYDLGTVELENRFADFDRNYELQQRTANEKRKGNRQSPQRDAAPSAAVDSADFIRDMDEMRRQQAANAPKAETPVAAPVSPPVITEPSATAPAEPPAAPPVASAPPSPTAADGQKPSTTGSGQNAA